MTCEDKYKNMKLKLKHKIRQICQHCQLCILTEKLDWSST